MSATQSAVGPAATNSCASADFTVFPTDDVACAVVSTSGLDSNITSALTPCCKDAPVEDFNRGCGYYCVSYEQTVRELQTCFMEGGVSPSLIICNSNNTASATASPSGTGAGSPTRTGGPSASGSGTDTNSPTSSGSPESSTSATSGSPESSPTSSDSPDSSDSPVAPDSTGAAPQGMSKAGLGMLGMVVFSAVAGALL